MSIIIEAVYYDIGNFIYLGAQWIISVLLVRLGGFGDAGEFSLAMTVSGVFGMIANYGLRSFQVSDVNGKYSDKTFMTSRLITMATGLLLCVLYSLFSGYQAKIVLLIVAYMLYKCVEAYADILSGIWQKNNDMRAVGFSLAIKGILNLSSFLLTYIITKQLFVSVAVMAASSFVVLLTFDFYKTKKYTSQKSLLHDVDYNQVKSLLKYGILTMAFVLLSTLFTGIPKLVIEQTLSTELLGVFSSVSAPTVLISTFAVGVLLPVVPKMAENYQNKKSKPLIKTIVYCNLIFAAVGIAAVLLSVLIGEVLFSFIFGDEILEYFSLFYWLIAASVLIAVVNCYSTFLIAIRKLKLLVAFSAVSCVIVFIMSLLFINKIGIYGAAYAMTATLIIQFIVESGYIFYAIKRNGKKDENRAEK